MLANIVKVIIIPKLFDSLHIFLSSGQIRFSPRSFCQYRAQTANEGCAPPPPHKTHSGLDVSLSVQPWVSVPFYILLNVSSNHLFSITSYVQCFVFLNTRKCICWLETLAQSLKEQYSPLPIFKLSITIWIRLYSFKYTKQMSIKAL